MDSKGKDVYGSKRWASTSPRVIPAQEATHRDVVLDNATVELTDEQIEAVPRAHEPRRYVIYDEYGNSIAYFSDEQMAIAEFDALVLEEPDVELALVRYDETGKIVERLR